MGGLAIYIAFILSVVVAFMLEYSKLHYSRFDVGILFIGATVILLLGIYDDTRGANPLVKFTVQFFVAGLLISKGLVITSMLTPWGNLNLGFLSIPITCLWIVGITNAINLIDGLDGLAVGIAAIVALSCLGLIYSVGGALHLKVICLALIGACLGFLRYNFYPAKIFMGDTGSLFLGFILAYICLEASCQEVKPANIIYFVLVLAIPVADTCFAFSRRLWKGRNPFVADKSHIHHWLFDRFSSHVKVVLILYSMSLLFGIVAVLLREMKLS
jgi:UDP-GlcNAc:undecaprenyl-phosphate GlcNAc-1-phosphate transferase